jgi:DNA mismatch endonuclease (patch repair protein)
MADVFSKKKRSEVMSRIRSRGNKATELALAGLLRKNKISGWRRHVQVRSAEFRVRNNSKNPAAMLQLRIPHSELRTFAVRPDFVFLKSRTAIFVDGCFWHGCPKHGTQPKGNRVFWKNKFARNKARDVLVTRTLRRADWRVLRIWEHELAKKNETRLIRRILQALK